MSHRDPQNYSIITYLWVLGMAALGGISHNIKKIKSGELKRFSFSELLGDLVISGFLGIVTFFLCEYANFEQILTAAIVGISSHQGTRGIYFIEELIARRFKIDLHKDTK